MATMKKMDKKDCSMSKGKKQMSGDDDDMSMSKGKKKADCSMSKGDKKAHPGFKAVEKKVEKEGYSKEKAGAIVASSARNASAKAKKDNPKLNKVKGK